MIVIGKIKSMVQITRKPYQIQLIYNIIKTDFTGCPNGIVRTIVATCEKNMKSLGIERAIIMTTNQQVLFLFILTQEGRYAGTSQ